MSINQSGIPITDNCILALNLDFEKGKEHILMGELYEIQRYLRGYKQAVILAEEKRELASFARECFSPMTDEMANVRIGLVEGLEKETPLFKIAQDFLEKLYQPDNLCHRFLAVRLWQEYHKTKAVYDKRLKSAKDKEYINTFIDRIEDLTLPFRFSIESDIMTWQCDHPKFPLRYFGEEYYRHPCGLLWAGNLANDEYGFATVSLMPLLMYSLKRIYDNHLYFQRCKLCDRLFLAKTANIPTYCGEDCKREAVRLNKQRFDEKAKELDYERQHKNSYMYWYNKVKKLQKEAPGSDRLAAVETAFEAFRTENMERKTAVKDGNQPEKEYIDWLYRMQGEIDRLMLE
jgi:hypothetical protein